MGLPDVLHADRAGESEVLNDEQPEPELDVVAIICAYEWRCDEALGVAFCESRFDSGALEHGNYGLFQINEIHAAKVPGHALDRLFDPRINTEVAVTIWRDQGWAPWAVECRP